MISNVISRINGAYIFNDRELGLQGCIAIDKINKHNVALGGTRLVYHKSFNDVIQEAVDLSRTMSKKCLVANLPFVGGKAVIMLNNTEKISPALEAYGRIIQSLNGAFITGCDFGTNNEHMKIVSSQTNYITGLITNRDYLSYMTALGVYKAMKICISEFYGKNSLKHSKVLIQGVGKIGTELALMLKKAGASIMISDTDFNTAKKVQSLLKCDMVEPNKVFTTDCDIFCPCAIGHVINEDSVKFLNCKIICGGANNPLSAGSKVLSLLDNRKIFLVPDWICNIGGAVYAAYSYLGKDYKYINFQLDSLIKKHIQSFIKFYNKYGLYNATWKFESRIVNEKNF